MDKKINSTPSEHVAHRIKMYRIRQNMKIETLAKKLHLSPSTVSKYENSKLSIDISTLFKIAKILNVSVNQLIDYNEPVKPDVRDSDVQNFFKRSNIFYFYQYFGLDKKIYACIMEVIPHPDGEDDNVIIYYDVHDNESYTDAEFIYKGTMNCNDLVTHIRAVNPYNTSDEVSICVKSPFSMKSTTGGVLIAVSTSLRNPYAAKVIFSLNALPIDDNLRDLLTIYDKDTTSEIKRLNALIIYK